jgi:hypothetical protein
VLWSTLPNDEIVQKVKQAASSIRGVQRLQKGDLVLVSIDDLNPIFPHRKQKWIYARVAAQTTSSMILLHLDPTETQIKSVPFDKVVPVAIEMLKKYFHKEFSDDVGVQNSLETHN